MRKIILFLSFICWGIEFSNAAPNTEILRRLKSIQNKIRRGIEPAAIARRGTAVMGLHGTSFESFEHLINHGYLPPGAVAKGYIYFEPTEDLVGSVSEINGAISSVKFYSQYNSTLVAARQILGIRAFSLDTNRAIGSVYDLISRVRERIAYGALHAEAESAIEYLSRVHGVKSGLVVPAVLSAMNENREGVLLSISKRVREHFQVHYGDFEDLRIRVGRLGLPLEFIHGVSFSGSYEHRMFAEKLISNGLPANF